MQYNAHNFDPTYPHPLAIQFFLFFFPMQKIPEDSQRNLVEQLLLKALFW